MVHNQKNFLIFRMSCLKTRKQELKSLSKVFTKADSEVVKKAVQASASLAGINICADEKAMRATYPPPNTNEAKKKVAAIREKLAEVDALEKTGKYQKGLELAKTIKEEADALDYKPTQAEYHYWIGRLLERVGNYKKAETTLLKALRLAGESRRGLLAVKTMAELVGVVKEQARFSEGLTIARDAQVMLDVAGGDNDALADLLLGEGNIFASQGKYYKALENFSSILALKEKALGPDHPELAVPLDNLGTIFLRQNKYDKTVDYYRRALAIREKALGSDHPKVAWTLNNLGLVYYQARQVRQGIGLFSQSLGDQREIAGARSSQCSYNAE